ncbi:MAG: 4Fe-4S dicluster domain-containing protein [Lachnospiraceae bacterium]|nr:4Fe-4S dicluster domain-containing protein [Lachnospiraceae bacterium]
MKIGIVTFHSAHNYGAVLQAWSLQEYLKQQGHQAEIVNLRLPVIDKLYRIVNKTNKRVTGIWRVDQFINEAYYQTRRIYRYIMPDSGKVEKYRKFENFINHTLPVTKEFNNYEDLCKAKLQYDALIAGSDQIWNAVMMKDINPAYFLQFANKNAIRISYAASIGTDEIPAEYKMLFRRYLRDFDHISVREKRAKEEVEALTSLPVDLVADPTFLLEREDFDKLLEKPKTTGKYIYVHNVHLSRVDEALNSVVEEMSKRLNLPVIHNWSKKVFSNEAGHFTGSVGEFLGLVASAEYVVTNSFHCTVFAIIYQRNFITVPHFKHPDRMRNLLDTLGISEHLIGDKKGIPEDLQQLAIDYHGVEEKKSAMGIHAREFLRKSLTAKKANDRKAYRETEDIFQCYGCGACKDICPQQAISMEADEEGFLYPKVDEESCVHCGKCEQVCIHRNADIRNKKEADFPAVYAACHKDKSVLDRSASGGAFTAMYRSILKKGGAVAGVRYGGDFQVAYDLAEDEEGCQRFCGSKNVFADSEGIKPKVKELLESGRYVLFSGAPCQIASLKSFLGRDYPKLYTVELICSGGGSPKVFRKYCDYLENTYKSKLVSMQFGNKFKGPGDLFVVTEFESGSIDVESAEKHNYNRAWLDGNIQRPSCYVCEFAGSKRGVADITIGDYKNVSKHHPDFGSVQGVSLVKINTQKGKNFFEEFKEELMVEESTWKAAYAANVKEPIQMGLNRAKLMSEIDEKPIEELLASYNRRRKV